MVDSKNTIQKKTIWIAVFKQVFMKKEMPESRMLKRSEKQNNWGQKVGRSWRAFVKRSREKFQSKGA